MPISVGIGPSICRGGGGQAAPPPEPITSDSFDRANSTSLGNTDVYAGGSPLAWTEGGDLAIASARLTGVTADGGGICYAHVESGESDVYARIKIKVLADSYSSGIVLRRSGTTHLMFGIARIVNAINSYEWNPSFVALRATAGMTWTIGQEYLVEVWAIKDLIDVRIETDDGVKGINPITELDSTLNQTATQHGVILAGQSAANSSDGQEFQLWRVEDQCLGAIYGDSIAQGGPLTYEQAYPYPPAPLSVQLLNRAQGGSDVINARARWEADNKPWSKLFIHSGVNAVAGIHLDEAGVVEVITPLTGVQTWALLESWIDAALLVHDTVYVATIAPWKNSGYWTETKQEYTDYVNAQIEAKAGIVVIPAFATLTDGNDALQGPYNSGDDIHVSQAGANALKAVLYALPGMTA